MYQKKTVNSWLIVIKYSLTVIDFVIFESIISNQGRWWTIIFHIPLQCLYRPSYKSLAMSKWLLMSLLIKGAILIDCWFPGWFNFQKDRTTIKDSWLFEGMPLAIISTHTRRSYKVTPTIMCTMWVKTHINICMYVNTTHIAHFHRIWEALNGICAALWNHLSGAFVILDEPGWS